MADVVDRGVIEIVGDARKLRAEIETAKRSIRTLGQGQKDVSRAASASIDQYIGRLQTQAATIKKSARETELFKLSLRGASNEQLNTANSALRVLERHQQTTKALASLKTGFLALGTAVGVGLGAALFAFDSLIKKAAEFQDIAEQTGDTAENFAALSVAAAEGGKSIRDLADFSIKLSKNLTGVDDEGEKAGAALKAIGLNIEAFQRLKPSEQIRALAEALNEFEDGQGKTQVMEALARGGAALIPTLKALNAETETQNILSEEQIRLADEWGDRSARVSEQISLTAAAIVTEMLPSLVDLKTGFLDVIQEIAGVEKGASRLKNSTAIQDFADNAVRVVAFIVDAFDGLIRTFQLVTNKLGTIAAVATAVATGQFGLIKGILAESEQQQTRIITRPTLGQSVNRRIDERRNSTEETTNLTPPRDRPTIDFKGAVKKKDSGDGLARAQLGADLDRIKRESDAIQNAFQNSERILQSMRAAGLVNDRDYFEAKRGFIKLLADEQERALQAEIARLQKETFTGKDAAEKKLDNDRKIADAEAKIAKIRADAATSTQINAIEQQAAIDKLTKAYEDAKAAAADYLDTIQRANQRDLAGLGRGQAFRERQAGLGQIDDKALAERRKLRDELRRGDIDQATFDRHLAVVEDTYRREVDLYEQRTAAIERAQGDWLVGAQEALANYVDMTRDVAKQTEDAITNAFRAGEDFFDRLTSGSIKSLKDLGNEVTKLVTGIAADFARIEVRQNILGPFAEWLRGPQGIGGPSPIEAIGTRLGMSRGGAMGTPLVDDGAPIPGVPAWLNALLGRKGAGAGVFTEGVLSKAGIPGLGGAAGQAGAGTAFASTVTASSTTFATTVTTAATTLSGEIAGAGATFAGEVSPVGTVLSTAATSIATAATTFATAVTTAGTQFAAAVAGASGTNVAAGAGDLVDDLIGGFGFFSEGGPVSGPGTPTSDSVPAMLSTNEFVVRAKAATEPGARGFLNTFNDHGLAAALAQPLRASLISSGVRAQTQGTDAAAPAVTRRVSPFAKGGILAGRREFPLAAGSKGVAGEVGPEAIMPLRRNRETGRPGVIVAGRPELALPVTRDQAGNMAVEPPSAWALPLPLIPLPPAPPRPEPTVRETVERFSETKGAIRETIRPVLGQGMPEIRNAAAPIVLAASVSTDRAIVPAAPPTLAHAALPDPRTGVRPSIAADALERVIGARTAHIPTFMPGAFVPAAPSKEDAETPAHGTIAQRLAVAVTAAALSMPLAAAPLPDLAPPATVAPVFQNARSIVNQSMIAQAAERLAAPVSNAFARQTTIGGPSVTNNTSSASSVTNVAGAAAAPAAALPFVGSFQQGIAFVPKTGIALVHEGERIVSKAQNKAAGDSSVNTTNNINIQFPRGTDERLVNHAVSELRRELRRSEQRKLS